MSEKPKFLGVVIEQLQWRIENFTKMKPFFNADEYIDANINSAEAILMALEANDFGPLFMLMNDAGFDVAFCALEVLKDANLELIGPLLIYLSDQSNIFMQQQDNKPDSDQYLN